jgi:hypothetical protein
MKELNNKFLNILSIFFFIFFSNDLAANEGYVEIYEEKILENLNKDYIEKYYPKFNAIKFDCEIYKKLESKKNIVNYLFKNTVKKNILFAVNRYIGFDINNLNKIHYRNKIESNSLSSISLVNKYSAKNLHDIHIFFDNQKIVENIEKIGIIKYGKFINKPLSNYSLYKNSVKIYYNELAKPFYKDFDEIIFIFKNKKTFLRNNIEIKMSFKYNNLNKNLINWNNNCYFPFSNPKLIPNIKFFNYLKNLYKKKNILYFVRLEPLKISLND